MDSREKIGIFRYYSKMKLKSVFTLRQIFANCSTPLWKNKPDILLRNIRNWHYNQQRIRLLKQHLSICGFHVVFLFFFLSIFLFFFCLFIAYFNSVIRVHYNKYLCATRDATIIVYTFEFSILSVYSAN